MPQDGSPSRFAGCNGFRRAPQSGRQSSDAQSSRLRSLLIWPETRIRRELHVQYVEIGGVRVTRDDTLPAFGHAARWQLRHHGPPAIGSRRQSAGTHGLSRRRARRDGRLSRRPDPRWPYGRRLTAAHLVGGDPLASHEVLAVVGRNTADVRLQQPGRSHQAAQPAHPPASEVTLGRARRWHGRVRPRPEARDVPG